VSTTAAHALRLRLGAGLPLLFDGGVSSELVRSGYVLPAPLGSCAAIRENPDLLADIHRRFVRAGATVLRANTARTTPRVLGQVGYEYRAAALTSRAVDLALDAIQEVAGVAAVAGVLAPLEGREDPDATPPDAVLHDAHGMQAQRLAAAGCDAVFLESMPTLREAVAATKAAVATGLPVFVSLAVAPDLRLLSGENLAHVVRAVRGAGADVLCVDGGASLGEAERAASAIAATGVPWGCLPDMPARASRDEFAALAERFFGRGASVFGGCGRVSPDDIAAVAAELRTAPVSIPPSA